MVPTELGDVGEKWKVDGKEVGRRGIFVSVSIKYANVL